ncbi:MAG TPA: hypothetical protein VF183_07345 [Acidimicrobiales bacterium]
MPVTFLGTCPVIGCSNTVDPRHVAHTSARGVVQVCDGHGMGGVCKAPDGDCTCPAMKPAAEPIDLSTEAWWPSDVRSA